MWKDTIDLIWHLEVIDESIFEYYQTHVFDKTVT